MLGIDLNAGYFSTGFRQPDRGVASQCPNLKDSFGVDELALDSQILTSEGGDGDWREPLGCRVGKCVIEFCVRF